MDCPGCGASLPPTTDPTLRETDCPECGETVDLSAGGESTRVVRPEDLEAADPMLGRTVGGGRYRIDAPLGKGGMGTVYRGTQISLGREVAIKVLSQDLVSDETFLRRFRREAGTLAALPHPNVVTVHDTGDEEGVPYIVMAYVAGPDGEPLSLRRVMDAGPLDPDMALRLGSEICAGLGFAHGREIIHRDVKPANVLLDRDWRAHVADFGIARAKIGPSTDPTLTVPGSSMGTVKYMAPEQWIDAAAVDARSDVYATGVLLYEMLTGQLPEGRFEMPTEVRPATDPRVDGIVARALQRDPDRRYPTIGEMQAEIDAVRSGRSDAGVATVSPVTSPPPGGPVSTAWPTPTPTPTPMPHHPYPTPTPSGPLVAPPPLATGPTYPPAVPGAPRPGSALAIVAVVLLLLTAGAEILAIWAIAEPRDLGLYNYRWRTTYSGYEYMYRDVDEEEQLAFVSICATVALAGWIVFLCWLHGAWRAVHPGCRRLAPAAAAWLLLVPGFNLYWIFRAVPGLSTGLRDTGAAMTPWARVRVTGRPLGILASAVAVVPILGKILLAVWLLVANAARNRIARAVQRGG